MKRILDAKVCFVIALIAVGVANASIKIESVLKPEKTNWSDIYHEGLYLYSQGEFTKCFELIENSVRTFKPGQEVHRCLDLMRLSFVKKNNMAIKLNDGAIKQIESIESLNDLSDIDVVILSTLKNFPYYYSSNELALNDIIESTSPWRDWAYWQKHRTISNQLTLQDRPSLTNIGLEKKQDAKTKKDKKFLIETHEPREMLRGRASYVFHSRFPSSYMARQMQAETLRANIGKIERLLFEIQNQIKDSKPHYLDKNRRVKFDIISSDLEEFIATFQGNEGDYLIAESRVDIAIANCYLNTQIIAKYFKAFANLKGKDSLPATINEWIESVRIAKDKSIDTGL